MKRSTDRILTTHGGSIPRPEALKEMLRARMTGGAFDPEAFEALIRSTVADVVRRQVECGIDIVNDGETSKSSFARYANERIEGFEETPHLPNQPNSDRARRDRMAFPEYQEEYQLTQPREIAVPVSCTGPLSYKGQALVQRDIDNLKSALQGLQYEEAFLPAVAPGTCARGRNDYFKTEEELRFAIADALKVEYKAIVDAGFILQVDDPAMAETWDSINPEPTVEEYRKLAAIRVDALNHALEGIPEDRVRYHLCWGSWQGPHVTDIALKDIVDLVLRVKAQAYSIEAANPRHEYEWQVWQDVKLPEGKILIPGVIAHTTAVVEHPETVAMRILNFARVVGRENVIAGADCGFAQNAFNRRQHISVMWAKLEALAEGARIATRKLWG